MVNHAGAFYTPQLNGLIRACRAEITQSQGTGFPLPGVLPLPGDARWKGTRGWADQKKKKTNYNRVPFTFLLAEPGEPPLLLPAQTGCLDLPPAPFSLPHSEVSWCFIPDRTLRQRLPRFPSWEQRFCAMATSSVTLISCLLLYLGASA